jgi:NodT family efflux transporter outer membrane factor (OMF) lipoprotein
MNRFPKRLIQITTLVLVVIAGCKVGPNYQNPKMPMPAQFGESTTRPTSRPSVDMTRWWDAFDDPLLNSIIDDAVQHNLDLKSATARLRQERALRGVTAADWFPTVNVDGSYDRQRRTGITSGTISGTGGNGNGGTTINGTNRYSSLWSTGFDATWELDIFGSVSRNVEAANADVEAAVFDRRDVLVTLLAEVASDYIDLRGAQRDLTITRNNENSQQQTLNLTRERFRAGIASDLDVAQAEAQVATTDSAIPTLEAEIRRDIHALGVLTGKDPEALSAQLSPPKDLLVKLPAVPLGMPSQLLQRRPDIMRSERQLASATALVGAAVADWFPKFSLTGSYSWQATKAAHLFSDANNFWDIGPSVTWPIFDAGRIRANIQVQNALTDQALDTYEKTVLTALQDVEDSMINYDREQARRVALAQAVSSNRRAVDLSNQLYSRGLIDFLTVLDSERQLFTAEDLLVRSDTAVSQDLIALYKALGGGWENTPMEDSTPR